MILIWLMLWIAAGVGFVLTIRGWRGRRVNDHSYCVRCKYDLYGLPEDSASCPECGADIREAKAVRVGLRRRRWGSLVAGVVCLLLSSSIAWLIVENPVIVRTYLPELVLKLDIQFGTATMGERAIFEVARRMAEEYTEDEIFDCVEWLIEKYPPGEYGERGSRVREVWDQALPSMCHGLYVRLSMEALTRAVPNSLIDLILDIQADSPDDWEALYGILIEAHYQQDRIDPERWDRYLANAASAHLEVRRRIERDDPIVFYHEARLLTGMFSRIDAETEIVAVYVDEQPLADLLGLEMGPAISADPFLFTLMGAAAGQIPAQPRDTVIPVHLFEGSSLLSEPDRFHTLQVDLIVRLWSDESRQELLHEKTLSCVSACMVLFDNETSVRLRDADEQRRLVGGGVLKVSLDPPNIASQNWVVTIKATSSFAISVYPGLMGADHDPDATLALAADVWMQIADRKPQRLGEIVFPYTAGQIDLPYTGPPPSPGDRIRFIFKPNVDLAKRTVDIHDIWGEEIVIERTYEPEED